MEKKMNKAQFFEELSRFPRIVTNEELFFLYTLPDIEETYCKFRIINYAVNNYITYRRGKEEIHHHIQITIHDLVANRTVNFNTVPQIQELIQRNDRLITAGLVSNKEGR